MIIIARRTRTDPCLPRRTIWLQAPTLLISQPPRPDRISHHASMPFDLFTTGSSVEAITTTCQPTRQTFVASALHS
jgi:hypothetical protein